MTTPAKLEANQQNATHSTGPRTAEGKRRSAANARTHGLTAERFLVAGEDAEAFEAFAAAYHEELQPVDVFAANLVDEIIGCSWRLARVPWIESGAVRRTIAENSLVDESSLAPRERLDAGGVSLD